MGKKVLLVDGGGRGHALAWRLRQSRGIDDLFVAPGNAGTAEIAENVPIDAKDVAGLLEFAVRNAVDFTVVGQDDPLALGIVDEFRARRLRIFGPTRSAARVEWSKVYSKRLMHSSGVRTAPFQIIDDPEKAFVLAREHFRSSDKPKVFKADGLALGKGSYVCQDLAEAQMAITEIMVQRLYGDAGRQMVVEDYVGGEEVSIHAFSDGTFWSQFPAAQDHKPIFDGDRGPNTGGMGAIAPVPWFTPESQKHVGKYVINPIIQGLRKRDRSFIGVLYPGLKIPKTGPQVLEFNARFGDPEAQVYMRLLKTDLLEIMEACVDGRLQEIRVEWNLGFAACVVLASADYPSPNYKKGLLIRGIEEAENQPGVKVFHAGTKMVDGQLVTWGGRVLGVTGVGPTLEDAIQCTYSGVRCIHFYGMQYRHDIGAKAFGRQ